MLACVAASRVPMSFGIRRRQLPIQRPLSRDAMPAQRALREHLRGGRAGLQMRLSSGFHGKTVRNGWPLLVQSVLERWGVHEYCAGEWQALHGLRCNHRCSQGWTQGDMPPRLFSISSHFVLWETVCQTKHWCSCKKKMLPPIFWACNVTGCNPTCSTLDSYEVSSACCSVFIQSDAGTAL